MDDDLVYLFTGKSEVFIRNRMTRIIQNYQKKKTTIIKYDMEQTSFDTVITDAITVPFLEEMKIIILNNPVFLTSTKEKIPADGKRFIQYLKKPSPSTLLIINATNKDIPLSNEYYHILRNVAVIIDCPEAQEIELKGWIVRLLAQEKISIKDDALLLFLDYLGGDQARMKNEIDKLISYVGPNGIITKSTIKLMVPEDITNIVFKMISAILDKNITLAQEIYYKISANTKDVMGVITLVTNKFKELFTTASLLKEGYSQSDIAKFYQISTNRAYYFVRDAKSFSLDLLKSYVIKMADLDYQIKSGQIDKKIGMELLLLKL